MDIPLQQLSPHKRYGTFNDEVEAPKNIAMQTLSGVAQNDQSIRAAIDQVFMEEGASADKKEVLVHLIKATQDLNLSEAIRQLYVDIINERNQQARSRPAKDGVASSGVDLSGANLTGMRFIGLKLDGADFSHAILHNTTWKDVSLEKANFHGAEFKGATLRNVKLWSANLSNAILIGATLQNVALQEADMTEAGCDAVDLRLTNLMKVNMTRAKLNNVLLDSNHSLIEVNFTDADLMGASLKNTYWENTILLRAELTDADWAGACLHNMDMGLALNVNLVGIAARSDDRNFSLHTRSDNCIVS